jgi:hypothetical protein
VRRPLLLTASTLGLLICLIGGTGLFAALTDSAHTGTNRIDSAALPGSADLKLASATLDPNLGFVCGAFSDHLATGLIDLVGSEPNLHYGNYFCLQNAGSQSVSLAGAADQLTDIDLDCTGDEADSGDASCGNNGAGELSSVFEVTFGEDNCAVATVVASYGPSLLAALPNTPQAMGTLGAGQTKCYGFDIGYGMGITNAEKQRAQSDRVTWRFVFSAQAQP